MLIKCPECGGDVSDKAKSCPHCGYRIATVLRSVALAFGVVRLIRARKPKSAMIETEEQGAYNAYRKAQWAVALGYLIGGLAMTTFCGYVGLMKMAEFGLFIAVVWSVRSVPTKKRYERLLQYEEARGKLNTTYDGKGSTVNCPICGDEISVDYVKCPSCRFKLGPIIDEIKKRTKDAARGKKAH